MMLEKALENPLDCKDVVLCFFPENEINQIGVWFSLKTRVAHVIFISLSNKQTKTDNVAGKYNSVKAVL